MLYMHHDYINALINHAFVECGERRICYVTYIPLLKKLIKIQISF